ncbi:Dihydrolipoyllysine-residue acetyltransferase component of pyruvate dehydrogenase complex [Nymphon striatum]|nr:Dihydrolipoyllysine-residue acetyltransferase component of pyruvate dehydrogenase complex [Nymphon striatum]
MSKEILVPDIGDFSEVDVIEILVNVGDTISVDDPLITLESDKASMDIPAPEGGVVKELKIAVGDSVSEGSLVLLLEASSEASVHVAVDDAQPKVSSEPGITAEPATSTNNYETGLEAVLVPDIGDFSEVDVIEVLVNEGDKVEVEDSLITLESDKASMDIPAPKAGIVKELKIVVGDSVSEGSLILMLQVEGSAPVLTSESAPAESEGIPVAASSQTSTAGSRESSESFRRAHASPSVRRIAREQGVDLAQLNGTGKNGRITEQDVHDFKASGSQSSTASATSTTTGTKKTTSAPESGMGIPVITQPDWSKFGEIETVEMSRINKLSAQHLHKAWLNVPQVTHFDEADITGLEEYRSKMKGKAKEMGFGFTPLVFMMKAAVAALKEYPKFNSAMDDAGENLIQRKYYNIGIAVDTPDGLTVPVIRDVDRKGLFELARELGEVSKRAREGQLKAADMQGGCFTISSLGGIGGTNFTPIVNAPEVGILGLTRSQMRLVRQDGDIVDRLIPTVGCVL